MQTLYERMIPNEYHVIDAIDHYSDQRKASDIRKTKKKFSINSTQNLWSESVDNLSYDQNISTLL